jgi:hypothetical protein
LTVEAAAEGSSCRTGSRMYEHYSQPLLPWPRFLRRASRYFLSAAVVILCVDLAGTLGYHALGGLPWIDAFLNAWMILAGMGPVDPLDAPIAKVFAAFYALFSGLVFIVVMGVVLSPWAHRMLHTLHVPRPR